jgi:hypothetical protein
MLALLFAIGGVTTAQWVKGRRGVLLAAVLCTLALWTKQTTLTAAVAVALAYTLRSWRTCLAFITLVAAPGLAIGAILNTTSNGEFVRHVLLGNASNPVLPLRAAIYFGTFAVLHLIALAAGVWWLRRALVGRPSPIALYFPITLLAAFNAGNGGSSVNYMIEPVLALALVVPLAWRMLPPAVSLCGPLFAVMQLAVLAHWPNSFGTNYLAESPIGRTPTAADASIGAQVDAVVRGASGDMIAEPASYAVRNALPVYVQPIDFRAEELQGALAPGALWSMRWPAAASRR